MDIRFKLKLCANGPGCGNLPRHWAVSANGARVLTVYAPTEGEALSALKKHLQLP